MHVMLALYTLLVIVVWILHIASGESLVFPILATETWACAVVPRWIQVRRRRR